MQLFFVVGLYLVSNIWDTLVWWEKDTCNQNTYYLDKSHHNRMAAQTHLLCYVHILSRTVEMRVILNYSGMGSVVYVISWVGVLTKWVPFMQ